VVHLELSNIEEAMFIDYRTIDTQFIIQ